MRSRITFSVRARMLLWNIGVVAVVLALFGVGLVFAVERILVSAIDRQLWERGQMVLRRAEGRPPGQPDFRPGTRHRGGPGPGGGQGPGGPPMGQMHPPPPGQGFGPRPGGRGEPGTPLPRPFFGPFPGPAPLPRPDARDLLPPRVIPVNSSRNDPNVPVPWTQEGYREAMSGRPGYRSVSPETADQPPLRVLSLPVFHDGRAVAVAQVAAPLAETQAAVRGVSYALILMIPGALLLIGFGALLLTDRALRPVGRLAQAASRIEAENLTERLPGGDARDEFGRLTGVLNGMLARLESAFERQKRFAADASHELRTPLATIKAASSYALEEGDALTPDEARHALASIDDATDRASRVVTDLLFLARAGTLPVRRERVPLSEVFEAARSSVAASAAGERLPAVEITVENPDLALWSDRDHLLRLLTNLLENAARHTPPDGAIHLTARPADRFSGRVLITVADTGEGIAPEHLPHLFEPFYRVDKARSRQRRSSGAGLGLAISRSIVEALGGQINVTSAVGKGTTFTVALPAGRPPVNSGKTA